MKIKSLYISSLEHSAGSLVVSIGIMSNIKRLYNKVAFFRPIIKEDNHHDNAIELMIKEFSLDIDYKECYGTTLSYAEELLADDNSHDLVQNIMVKYKQLEDKYDFVLIQGLSQSIFTSVVDFDINILLAKNLQAPYISVLKINNQKYKELHEDITIESNTIKESALIHYATFVNRVDPNQIDTLKSEFSTNDKEIKNLFLLPQTKELSTITMSHIKTELNAKLIVGGKEELNRISSGYKIASMNIDNFLPHISENILIIVSGDRTDIILATLSALHSNNYPNVSGIILTGGIIPSSAVTKLLQSLSSVPIAIMSVQTDTYTTAIQVDKIKPILTHRSKDKISSIFGMFNKYVDEKRLLNQLSNNTSTIMTPIMFEYSLFQRAKKDKKTIVLPESSDERILKATQILLSRQIVDIILIGNEDEVRSRARFLGINIDKATIIDPKTSQLIDEFAEAFYTIRKNKCILKDEAKHTMLSSDTYFATMMVHLGYADGMVSGAINTTADTIRPALQIIKTKKDVSIVSSCFFMCLDTKVLVYADCAVNQDPNSKHLAQIAISSSQTAQNFGIEPKVAMLSYSTGDSGSGQDVQKVLEATNIVKNEYPKLAVEGPIQYDAAIDKSVAKSKLPNSKVAGEATVLVFPDLNTGNNTYKAVQRSSNAVAIGPVLQGLNKPVNDLSRGCLIDDIVNTVAITAIQAGE
jgi:phosphate acetyltransferase